jgi:vacuolar-type H+-ATPase subunit C/Vma6
MTRGWEDVVARVRGIASHFLTSAQLVELGRARDLVQLAAGLEAVYSPQSGLTTGATAERIELEVRRMAASRLRLLARWSGDRLALLTPIFLDEDRHSVRSLLRGAAAGSPAVERLAGLVPTPDLPERALEELVRQQSVSGVAALLAAWSHPFGGPLLVLTRGPNPDLLRIDVRLNEVWAARSITAVRRAPRTDAVRRDLIAFVRESIDVENASTALQLASYSSKTDIATLFTPGGQRLDRETFVAAAGSHDSNQAAQLVARAFHGTPLAGIVAMRGKKPFEDATLKAQLRYATDVARRFPLGVAPIIAFVVRLRAEVRNLRLIIWRVASGAPPLSMDALVALP